MPDDQGAHGGVRETDTIAVLRNRVSVRKYSDRPVDDATVDAVLQAAFRAPTSSNIQSYSVVVVRDRDTLAKLSKLTGGQKHVAETPVFLAFCADLTRIAYAMEKNGHTIENNNFEMGLVSSIDAALVGQSAYMVAESLGLRGVMIGAIRNDAVAAAELLGLPRGVYCVFGMCLGWPAEAPVQKPRMGYGGMVHDERYGNLRGGGTMQQVVDAYDTELAAHYTATGKPTTPDSWTNDVDKKFSVRPRDRLREQLRTLGFDFL